jgi:hypothetical protein
VEPGTCCAEKLARFFNTCQSATVEESSDKKDYIGFIAVRDKQSGDGFMRVEKIIPETPGVGYEAGGAVPEC